MAKSNIKQEIQEHIQAQADTLVQRFNHGIGLQLEQSGIALNEQGELDSAAKTQFIGSDHVKVYLEIDPDMTIRIEKLNKTLQLIPEEDGYQLESVNKQFDKQILLELLTDVNEHLSANVLAFRSKAQKSNGDLAYGCLSNVDNTFYQPSRNSERDHMLNKSAKDTLGLE